MFIATCPECGDSLTFPSGVALTSRCRCPLCTETFTLEDCLSELPPMAEVLEGGFANGSGLSPALGGGAALATAPRAATGSRLGSATAGPRTAGRPPAKKAKGGSPVIQMVQIVVGGAVGVTLAVLIIWWGLGKDPFNLAPTVAQYAPFLVPTSVLPGSEPEIPQPQAGSNGRDEQGSPRNARRQQGVVLDGSRFATEEEQAQTPNRDRPRTSLDPDAGELSADEPTLEAFSTEFDGGLSPIEPSLDSFELPGIDAAPAPTLEAPTFDPPAGDAALEAPSLDAPMEESPEEGAFELQPLSAEPPTDDPLPVDPTVPAGDPFAIVFPTATEDLPELAAAEAEAWQTYVAASGESGDVRRELAQAHYEQLASVAQTLAGLPPSPRSSAAIAETTSALAGRFDESFERRVANLHARQRLTDPDFGLAGVVVVGRVARTEVERDHAMAHLSIEEGGSEAVRRVVAVVREAQGVPAQGSLVVAYGVQLAGGRETLPASLADEQAPIVLAAAVAPVAPPADSGQETEQPAAGDASENEPAPGEPSAVEETPAPEPTPEPAPTEPLPESAPSEPSPDAAAPPAEAPAPGEPAPQEPPAEEPAPSEPAPSEPAIEEAPAPDAPAEEPAPAESGEES